MSWSQQVGTYDAGYCRERIVERWERGLRILIISDLGPWQLIALFVGGLGANARAIPWLCSYQFRSNPWTVVPITWTISDHFQCTHTFHQFPKFYFFIINPVIIVLVGNERDNCTFVLLWYVHYASVGSPYFYTVWSSMDRISKETVQIVGRCRCS